MIKNMPKNGLEVVETSRKKECESCLEEKLAEKNGSVHTVAESSHPNSIMAPRPRFELRLTGSVRSELMKLWYRTGHWWPPSEEDLLQFLAGEV